MTDSARSMVGHVALRVRLVYEVVPVRFAEGAGSGDFPRCADSETSVQADVCAAISPLPAYGTDVPGWDLVGLLPEDVSLGDAGVDFGDPAGPAGASAGRQRFATDPMELTLDRDEAEGYYLNLTSPQPSLFALIRLPDVASATAAHAPAGIPEAEAITASYNEAARWMDGGMVVIRTALPEPLLAWIAEFAQHHFQVQGRKKGGKFRPSFLSRQQFADVSRAAQEEASQLAVPPEGTRP